MALLAISLLTILAGTLLLAKFKKEAAGKLFAIISWFFIVVGCLLFIGFIVGGIWKYSRCDNSCQPKYKHEMMMMKKCGHEMPECCPEKMEKCMHGMMPGCCMKKDSAMMKDCMKHMECDSTKMPVKKK